MKLRLNKTIAIVLVILGLIMASVASYLIEPAQATDKCPDGTYKLSDGGEKTGGLVCKKEPTGCPFDENTPLDECKPPVGIECNKDYSYCDAVESKPPVNNQPQYTEVNSLK